LKTAAIGLATTEVRGSGVWGVPESPSLDSNAFLAAVGDGKISKRYRKNQTVFAQGDRADAVFYIERGKVKLTVVSSGGKEAILAILGDGDFLGEECLASRTVRLSSAVPMTETLLTRVEKPRMLRMLQDDPAFCGLFVSYVLSRTIRIEEHLVDQLFNSSEKRLARMLLLLANFGKEGKPEPVIAKISQATLAKMIGTTRSRVNFFMNKFRSLGFIDYESDAGGRFEVHSSLLNVILHD
jgi:CRP/FNR family transcriptional regulator, cyclic AMP receptor protein